MILGLLIATGVLAFIGGLSMGVNIGQKLKDREWKEWNENRLRAEDH